MKKLHDVRWCARRYLAAMKMGTTDVRVYPGYIPFEAAHRPAWWTDDHSTRTDIHHASYDVGPRPSWWKSDIAPRSNGGSRRSSAGRGERDSAAPRWGGLPP